MAGVLDNIFGSSLSLLESLKENQDLATKLDLIRIYLETGVQQCVFHDFADGLEWFNVRRPLTVTEDLPGKVTVLDFFTYCCINCLHVLPVLNEIEKSIPIEDGLVIVGVHSAKFDNEKDSKNIKAALARYNISHPVVNDADGVMWNTLGIAAWPTMLVLDPNAQPLFVAAGEHYMPEVKLFIETALQYYKENGLLSPHVLPVAGDVHLPVSSLLLFPGKIAFCSATPSSRIGYLAIADTGHNRILICRYHGEVEYIVGGEEPGFSDGQFDVAKFSSPQGVSFHGVFIIYVADTGNNAIRKIDLATREVTTLVNKRQITPEDDSTSDVELSSPWDLCVTPDDSLLLIAAAGNHQLWAYVLKDRLFWRKVSLKAGSCVPVAGTGREENRNNAYPHAAAFAQPSGICVAPEIHALFVADSESSSIRRIDVRTGLVMAVVGGNRSPTDLYYFGDIDGRMWEVKLQHPLGVAWSSSYCRLYVADSYNHKIKVIEPVDRICRTVLGSGTAGDSVEKGKEQFSEPGGLCVSTDHLFVADTNNHCIKKIDLQEMEVARLNVHLRTPKERDIPKSLEAEAVVDIGGAFVVCDIQFDVRDVFPGACSWTLELPSNFGWLADCVEGRFADELPLRLKKPVTIFVPPRQPQQESEVLFFATVVTCDKTSGVCSKKCMAAGVIIRQVDDAPAEVFLGPEDFRQLSGI